MLSEEHRVLSETVGPSDGVAVQSDNQPQPGPESPRSGVPWAESVRQELDAVTATLVAAVGEARVRLLALVHREIRRGLEQALESARAELNVPELDVMTNVTDRSPINIPPASVDTPASTNGTSEIAGEEQLKDSASIPLIEEPAEHEEAPGERAVEEPVALEEKRVSEPSVASGTSDEQLDELFNGTVRLTVESEGSVRRLVQFVDEVCRSPQLRMLRLVGNRSQTGVEVLIGLREPLHLAKTLSQMKGVSHVATSVEPDGKDGVHSLSVWLGEEASVA